MRRTWGGNATDNTSTTITTSTTDSTFPTVAAAAAAAATAATAGGGGGGGGGGGLPATKECPLLRSRAVRQVVRGQVVRESAAIRGIHVSQI